jgi:sec-independent protein translocase protein TatA
MFEGILQPTHLILILVIVLIIFGPGKLPELGKGLGQSIRELRNSASGDQPGTAPIPEQTTTKE